MNIFAAAAVCLTVAIGGCNSDQTSEARKPGVNDSANRPDTEVYRAQISLYDRGRVTTAIQAEKIRKFDQQDSTMAYKLDVDTYDSTGGVTSHIVGDSGIIRESTNLMRIFGNVVVDTDEGTRLETDYLTWNPIANKIETDAFVRFTRDEDVITGWGFEANRSMTRFKVLNQVSGTITNTEDVTK
jgi:LPS export ABC transporter protein LptC